MMGVYCCKSEQGPHEITELDDYNKNTYGNTYDTNQNNNEDMFITRPPCWYKHQCPCPCHNQGSDSGGSCIFKIQSK